jgi:hypothetical protein
MWASSSPARRVFGTPPDPLLGGGYRWPADSKLEAFAIAAITHQPWQYVSTTIQGLLKYVDPNLGTADMLVTSQSGLVRELHDPQVTARAAPVLAGYYRAEAASPHSLTAADAYADAARVEGPVTLALIALMLAGFVLARERRRAAAGLLGWTTVVMMVGPVALLGYGTRYATPSYGPLAAAAAIGMDEVIDLGRRLRSRRPSHARPPAPADS